MADETTGKGTGRDAPGELEEVRRLSITARAVVMLATKLRDQGAQSAAELPRDDLDELLVRAEAVRDRLDELSRIREAPAAGEAPARGDQAPAGAEAPARDEAPDDDEAPAGEEAPGADEGPEVEAADQPEVEAADQPDDHGPVEPESGDDDAISLVALDLAAAGKSREEVDAYLHEELGATDTAAILDRVFESDAGGQQRGLLRRRGRKR